MNKKRPSVRGLAYRPVHVPFSINELGILGHQGSGVCLLFNFDFFYFLFNYKLVKIN
jgi:hypothetical protein